MLIDPADNPSSDVAVLAARRPKPGRRHGKRGEKFLDYRLTVGYGQTRHFREFRHTKSRHVLVRSWIKVERLSLTFATVTKFFGEGKRQKPREAKSHTTGVLSLKLD